MSLCVRKLMEFVVRTIVTVFEQCLMCVLKVNRTMFDECVSKYLHEERHKGETSVTTKSVLLY